MSQSAAQHTMDGAVSMALSPYFLKRLQDLPAELKGMIGGFMAAHSLQRLRAVTCSNKIMRDAELHNQSQIVQYAVNSISSLYLTAGQLYYGRSPPDSLHLGHFFRIARKYDIAIQLDITLADQNGDIASEATYDKFIKNVVPYIVTLGHVFECFRDGLASWRRVRGSLNLTDSPYYPAGQR